MNGYFVQLANRLLFLHHAKELFAKPLLLFWRQIFKSSVLFNIPAELIFLLGRKLLFEHAHIKRRLWRKPPPFFASVETSPSCSRKTLYTLIWSGIPFKYRIPTSAEGISFLFMLK